MVFNEQTQQWETNCHCLIGIETIDSDISKIYGDYDKSDIPLAAWDMLGKNMSDGSIVLIQCDINGWPGLLNCKPGVGQILTGYTRAEVINLIKHGDRYRIGLGGQYREIQHPIMAKDRSDFRSLLNNKRAVYAYLYTQRNNWLVTGIKLDWEPLRGDSRDNMLAYRWRDHDEKPDLHPYNVLTPKEEVDEWRERTET